VPAFLLDGNDRAATRPRTVEHGWPSELNDFGVALLAASESIT